MKVLVCGGMNFRNGELLVITLDPLYWGHEPRITHLIEGEAYGADKMSAWWASAYDIKIERYPANWALHGKAAGYIRNKQMLEEGKPDLVIAFPGGKGTADLLQKATRAKIEIWQIKPSGEPS